MSTRELDRLEILGRGAARRLTQRQAVEQLGSTERQVGRLCRELRQQGAAGLVSHKRGRPSNRQWPPAVREQAVALLRERYADFGPMLSGEELAAHHDVAVCLRHPAQAQCQIQQMRPRRERTNAMLHDQHRPC